MLSDEGPASLPSVDSDGIPIDEDDEDGNEEDTEETPISRSSRLQQVRHLSFSVMFKVEGVFIFLFQKKIYFVEKGDQKCRFICPNIYRPFLIPKISSSISGARSSSLAEGRPKTPTPSQRRRKRQYPSLGKNLRIRLSPFKNN